MRLKKFFAFMSKKCPISLKSVKFDIRFSTHATLGRCHHTRFTTWKFLGWTQFDPRGIKSNECTLENTTIVLRWIFTNAILVSWFWVKNVWLRPVVSLTKNKAITILWWWLTMLKKIVHTIHNTRKMQS